MTPRPDFTGAVELRADALVLELPAVRFVKLVGHGPHPGRVVEILPHGFSHGTGMGIGLHPHEFIAAGNVKFHYD
jgi:hypothetical protein